MHPAPMRRLPRTVQTLLCRFLWVARLFPTRSPRREGERYHLQAPGGTVEWQGTEKVVRVAGSQVRGQGVFVSSGAGRVDEVMG